MLHDSPTNYSQQLRTATMRDRKQHELATARDVNDLRHEMRRIKTAVHELERKVQFVNPAAVEHMSERIARLEDIITQARLHQYASRGSNSSTHAAASSSSSSRFFGGSPQRGRDLSRFDVLGSFARTDATHSPARGSRVADHDDDHGAPPGFAQMLVGIDHDAATVGNGALLAATLLAQLRGTGGPSDGAAPLALHLADAVITEHTQRAALWFEESATWAHLHSEMCAQCATLASIASAPRRPAVPSRQQKQAAAVVVARAVSLSPLHDSDADADDDGGVTVSSIDNDDSDAGVADVLRASQRHHGRALTPFAEQQVVRRVVDELTAAFGGGNAHVRQQRAAASAGRAHDAPPGGAVPATDPASPQATADNLCAALANRLVRHDTPEHATLMSAVADAVDQRLQTTHGDRLRAVEATVRAAAIRDPLVPSVTAEDVEALRRVLAAPAAPSLTHATSAASSAPASVNASAIAPAAHDDDEVTLAHAAATALRVLIGLAGGDLASTDAADAPTAARVDLLLATDAAGGLLERLTGWTPTALCARISTASRDYEATVRALQAVLAAAVPAFLRHNGSNAVSAVERTADASAAWRAVRRVGAIAAVVLPALPRLRDAARDDALQRQQQNNNNSTAVGRGVSFADGATTVVRGDTSATWQSAFETAARLGSSTSRATTPPASARRDRSGTTTMTTTPYHNTSGSSLVGASHQRLPVESLAFSAAMAAGRSTTFWSSPAAAAPSAHEHHLGDFPTAGDASQGTLLIERVMRVEHATREAQAKRERDAFDAEVRRRARSAEARSPAQARRRDASATAANEPTGSHQRSRSATTPQRPTAASPPTSARRSPGATPGRTTAPTPARSPKPAATTPPRASTTTKTAAATVTPVRHQSPSPVRTPKPMMRSPSAHDTSVPHRDAAAERSTSMPNPFSAAPPAADRSASAPATRAPSTDDATHQQQQQQQRRELLRESVVAQVSPLRRSPSPARRAADSFYSSRGPTPQPHVVRASTPGYHASTYGTAARVPRPGAAVAASSASASPANRSASPRAVMGDRWGKHPAMKATAAAARQWKR